MAEITAKAVKDLRDLTSLPMMEVKRALAEANGDQNKAIELLKEWNKKVSSKRAANATSEGVILTVVAPDGALAAMVELQCESAQVAKADDFLFLGNQLAKQLLAGAGAATPEELLAQPAPDRAGSTRAGLMEDVIGKVREKIVLARVLRVAGPVGAYSHHDGKTGVLFAASGENKLATVLRDVAMHVAALKPVVTHPEELAAADVAVEKERLTAEAAASGKPANILEKIVEGRMKTYYAEHGVLGYQLFAKDDSKTVNQALAESGLKPVSFTRWLLGN